MLLEFEAGLHGSAMTAGCLAGDAHVDTAHHPPVLLICKSSFLGTGKHMTAELNTLVVLQQQHPNLFTAVLTSVHSCFAQQDHLASFELCHGLFVDMTLLPSSVLLGGGTSLLFLLLVNEVARCLRESQAYASKSIPLSLLRENARQLLSHAFHSMF